ncbi:MAG: hypothetical protein ACXW1W_03545 [Methylococcaceae bacterium]
MTKYVSKNLGPIKNFVILFLLVGYPKDPLFGLPLSLVLLVLFFKEIILILRRKIYFPQIFTIFLFGLYCCTRWLFQYDSSLQDFIFIIVLIYKALTGIIIAKVFFELLEKNYKLIYLYLIIQLSLMVASAYYSSLYDFLLMFQTESAQDVFMHTFGMRSMGFGVIHNEGVAFLVLFYSFLIYKNESSTLGLFFSPLMYISAFSSRMSLILIVISQALLSPFKLIVSICTILFLLFFLFDTSSGPLSEVFELYNNFISSGELGTRSTNAISEMPYVPDNFLSWLLGDGKFFENDGFYMETDIGFSRMVFFGGIVGLIFYLLISFWPFLFIDFKNRDFYFYVFLLNLLICFIIVNIKGINIQNWAFIVYLLMSKTKYRVIKQFE